MGSPYQHCGCSAQWSLCLFSMHIIFFLFVERRKCAYLSFCYIYSYVLMCTCSQILAIVCRYHVDSDNLLVLYKFLDKTWHWHKVVAVDTTRAAGCTHRILTLNIIGSLLIPSSLNVMEGNRNWIYSFYFCSCSPMHDVLLPTIVLLGFCGWSPLKLLNYVFCQVLFT